MHFKRDSESQSSKKDRYKNNRLPISIASLHFCKGKASKHNEIIARRKFVPGKVIEKRAVRGANFDNKNN